MKFIRQERIFKDKKIRLVKVPIKRAKQMDPKKLRAIEKKLRKTGGKFTNPTMIKINHSIKSVMMLLDDTFRYLKQRPPAMIKSQANPVSQFLIRAWDLMDRWPEHVAKKFVEELYSGNMPEHPSDVAKIAKQIVTETFSGQASPKDQPYLARWRMWPHQRDEDYSEAEKEKENLMASKLAAKKKVSKKGAKDEGPPFDADEKKDTKASKKKGKEKPVKEKKAKKEGGGSRAGALTDETKLTRKKAKYEKEGQRNDFLEAMGAKPFTFKALKAHMKTKLKFSPEKTKSLTLVLRRRGYITATE